MNPHGPESFIPKTDEEGAPTSAKQFRCPFEVKGELDQTIMDVNLGDNPESRIQEISKAFSTFHCNPKSPGIRFHLPQSLLDQCNSNEELKPLILPYQTEVLAGELDYRLNPFLPYQMRTQARDAVLELFKKEPYKLACASELVKIMEQCGSPEPKTASDIANWMEPIMKDAMQKGMNNPQLRINDPEAKTGYAELMTISPGSVVLHPEREGAITDPKNQNCFGMVRTPFYPKEFGRYSKDIEIAISRELDFASLPKEARQKIRTDANKVLQIHGVDIVDLASDKQGDGLWIPDYKKE